MGFRIWDSNQLDTNNACGLSAPESGWHKAIYARYRGCLIVLLERDDGTWDMQVNGKAARRTETRRMAWRDATSIIDKYYEEADADA